MVQSPSWEANWFAARQEIPRISRNLKVHYRTHKCPPPVPILGQPNPVHIPTSHLLEIHPNIIHPSTPRSPQWSLYRRFPHEYLFIYIYIYIYIYISEPCDPKLLQVKFFGSLWWFCSLHIYIYKTGYNIQRSYIWRENLQWILHMGADKVTKADFQTEKGRWFLFHNNILTHPELQWSVFWQTVVPSHINQLLLFPKVMMTLKRRIFQDTEEDIRMNLTSELNTICLQRLCCVTFRMM